MLVLVWRPKRPGLLGRVKASAVVIFQFQCSGERSVKGSNRGLLACVSATDVKPTNTG